MTTNQLQLEGEHSGLVALLIRNCLRILLRLKGGPAEHTLERLEGLKNLDGSIQVEEVVAASAAAVSAAANCATKPLRRGIPILQGC